MCALEGCQHRLSTTIQEGEVFGPARGDVGEGQGVQIASLCLYAAVGDKVCLQKARLRFIPVLESADRDLVFEEGSCLGSGYPARTALSLGAQEPIRRRCAHREQLAAALLGEVEMSMPHQRFNEGGQKGDQPFGTDLIGGAPC